MERVETPAASAAIELDTIQNRRNKARELYRWTEEVADYAREVASEGSWSDRAFGPTLEGGWESLDYDFVGTNFVPITDGVSVAIREIAREVGGQPRHELLMQSDEGAEIEVLARIDGPHIEIDGVGKPEFHEVSAIKGLLDYIAGHETR
ncbi:MAG TPA: hypothetical protein VEH48_02770 [Candidatus Nitrosopolaris sp.]|nr:hypothetical protein [Candidatus Nitrosopolaris sp.]